MIEDKELGLKIAENEEEQYWKEIIENTEKDLDNLRKLVKFQEAVLAMAQQKKKEAI